MVEAAKSCASKPMDPDSQEALKRAAENLRTTTDAAVRTTIKRKMIKRLENASKHAAATATQCIAASQGAGGHNSNPTAQDELMDSCKAVADVIPRLVEGVKMSMQSPDSAMAQLNLINNAELFIDPTARLTSSTRSAIPTVNDQSSSLQLSNSSKQLDNAVKDLKNCISKAHQVCGSLEMEASADLIEALKIELDEFRQAATSFGLKPLPGENSELSSLQLNTATKSVGSTVASLLNAANEGNEEITSRAARDTANALRDFTAAVRGVAATSRDKSTQLHVIEQAQLVMNKSALLVLEAQRGMSSPSDPNRMRRLSEASKEVNEALGMTLSCLPGQQELESTITQIDQWTSQIDSGHFPSSGRPYGELQSQLTNAADILNEATSDVVQSAPRPEKLSVSSKHFSQVLGQMMDVSMDMAGQTGQADTRTEMVSTMRSVTTSSSTFLSSAKTVSIDPTQPQAKNNLALAARGVTETINNLINVYTSAAPGQTECDNAIRAIQSSRHVLENANQCISDMSYFECLDTVMEKSKALGDGMTGIANHAKHSEHDEFGDAVKGVSEAICGLVEAASQAAYLVGVADPSSVGGKRGLVDQAQFLRAAQAIKQACDIICNPSSGQQQILTSATVIAKQTSALCNACRMASSKTSNPVAKKQFVQSAKDVANATATLVKEIKVLDSNYNDANRARCAGSTKPLIEAVDRLCQFTSTPEYASVPAKISEQGREAQKPITQSGHFIIEGSCSMITSAKSLAVNPKDPPTWQSLANSSKSVSDAIKKLVSSIRDKAPGQRECEDAIEKLVLVIRELDQASLAAINQNLQPRKDKDIKAFAEQMENAAAQLSAKLPDVQVTAQSEAERLGHAITAFVSYFDPLVQNSIGCASNMVSSKQQVLLLDQTKTVAECAQQMLYAAKESGGNPKAQHVHGDIDASADDLVSSIKELLGTMAKLAPNIAGITRMVNCITEAVYSVEDYRPGSRGADEGDASGFVMYQSRMMSSTKEIAKTAQDIVIKSSSSPDQLGTLASHISVCYQELASDSRSASASMNNADIGARLRSSVKELGNCTIELIKSTGTCQVSPHDSFALRDVSENARSVGEKVTLFFSSLVILGSKCHGL